MNLKSVLEDFDAHKRQKEKAKDMDRKAHKHAKRVLQWQIDDANWERRKAEKRNVQHFHF